MKELNHSKICMILRSVYFNNGSKSTGNSGGEKTDQECYLDWIQVVGNGEGEAVKQEQVLECVKHMSKIFKLVADV